jgi:hypothetical protein
MSFHDWFGAHVANLKTSHWEVGYFVTECTKCGRAMVKLPGLPWRLRGATD